MIKLLKPTAKSNSNSKRKEPSENEKKMENTFYGI